MVGSDAEYEVPLRDQRFFGAGIRRQGIAFVKAATNEAISSEPAPKLNSSERYLAIVFPNGVPKVGECSTTINDDPDTFCQTCQTVIGKYETMSQHQSSISHQIQRPHSNPPSNIDRSRMGLSVLQRHGWDPDAGLGLGAQEEGIVHPLKPRANQSRSGIGAKPTTAAKVEKPVRMHAGQVRALEIAQKKKAERLRKEFYSDGKEEKYLVKPARPEYSDTRAVAGEKPARGRWV